VNELTRAKTERLEREEKASADAVQILAALGPIARSSIVQALAERLEGEILAGRIPAGTRLPSERELAIALGVNRLTLRAALAKLEALGLITTRHGAGTIVAPWRERAGLDALTTLVASLSPSDPLWLELVESTLEIRRILACEAIALAATRRTDEDLGAMTACADALRHVVHDPVAYARADLAFMRAVVRAARNVGLELLLNTFSRFPDEQPALVRALYDSGEAALEIYPIVLELIRSGDAEGARGLVRRALEQMDEGWRTRHQPLGKGAERDAQDESAAERAPETGNGR
jgi:GntR family transcriptional repressor for pyruvate dehydrogenase complex